MAGTYIDMVTRIQDDLVGAAVTTAQIKAAIQTAIALYENTPFYFNQKQSAQGATFSTVAAQEYYGAAALADIPNIGQITNMMVTTNNVKIPVQPVDFSIIDKEQSGAVSSLPYWYAYYGQQIRLYPMPDQVYTISLSYDYKLTTLSADSDTSAWMTDGEEMVRQCAKRRLALDTLYDDAMAARCKVLEDEAYDGLLELTRLKLPNTTLRIPAMTTPRTFNIYTGR